MRTQILKGAGAATMFGLLVLCAPVQAADVTAKVPFSFSVNKKVLPPGTYSVSTGTAGAGTLIVNSFGGGAITLSTRLESREATSPKLVFHRYGDEYILREVWMGAGSGHALPQSPRERELAGARNGAATARLQRVEIPLL